MLQRGIPQVDSRDNILDRTGDAGRSSNYGKSKS
jgi:hypothetical protein